MCETPPPRGDAPMAFRRRSLHCRGCAVDAPPDAGGAHRRRGAPVRPYYLAPDPQEAMSPNSICKYGGLEFGYHLLYPLVASTSAVCGCHNSMNRLLLF
ncbi:hypothetical protein CEXT_644171 [Caerostris extrusa]|uniref:Uncharacterized protein n=1 Tax=Caerostris extrusa TaxID=172846 RepID=A0AAV4TVZ8_CAEEX|nr:hypothetical protein CEXT_644171 [Caerostris extrusa]